MLNQSVLVQRERGGAGSTAWQAGRVVGVHSDGTYSVLLGCGDGGGAQERATGLTPRRMALPDMDETQAGGSCKGMETDYQLHERVLVQPAAAKASSSSGGNYWLAGKIAGVTAASTKPGATKAGGGSTYHVVFDEQRAPVETNVPPERIERLSLEVGLMYAVGEWVLARQQVEGGKGTAAWSCYYVARVDEVLTAASSSSYAVVFMDGQRRACVAEDLNPFRRQKAGSSSAVHGAGSPSSSSSSSSRRQSAWGSPTWALTGSSTTR